MHGPETEEADCRRRKGGGRGDAGAPRQTQRERQEREHEQCLVARAHQDEERDPDAEGGEAPGRRCDEDSHREQRPQREGNGENGVRGQLVEQDRVARVQEQDDGHGQRRPSSERARSEEPGGDRYAAERRHPEFGESAAERIEQRTDDERRDRRAAEHVAEIDRIRLEELDVRAEIRPEIASGDERHRHCFEPPERDGDEEDGQRSPAGLGRDGDAVGLTPCLAEPAHCPTG